MSCIHIDDSNAVSDGITRRHNIAFRRNSGGMRM